MNLKNWIIYLTIYKEDHQRGSIFPVLLNIKLIQFYSNRTILHIIKPFQITVEKYDGRLYIPNNLNEFIKVSKQIYFLQFCLRFYLIMRVKFVFDSKLYDDFSGRFLILCQSYST